MIPVTALTVTIAPPSAAQGDHSDVDCFLLVFLSHGENDHVYTYDGKISIQDITALFKGDKCQSLVGKPKIFILQVCVCHLAAVGPETCARRRRNKATALTFLTRRVEETSMTSR